jgi:DNA mismatch repair ATPase MutS
MNIFKMILAYCDDIIYNYIRKPLWWYRLWKKIEKDYISFDISDSSINILFAQFEILWSIDPERTSNQIKWQQEEKKKCKDYGFTTKKEIQEWKKGCDESIQKYMEITSIAHYVLENRKYNKEIFDALLTYCFNDVRQSNVSINDMISAFKNIKMTWKFDEDGRLDITSYKEVDYKTDCLFKLEDAIEQVDTEMAQKLIGLRGYLWD